MAFFTRICSYFGPRPEALFGDGLAKDAPKILCRDDGMPERLLALAARPSRRIAGGSFKPNLAMGALLLPKTLVVQAMEGHLEPQGLLGLPNAAGQPPGACDS